MLIFDQVKRGDPQLRAITFIMALGMALLVSGLWYVQVVSARRYRADLVDQSFRTVRVPAIRGKILDRYGVPLAENRPTYNLNLYLEELRRSFRFEYTNRILSEYRAAYPHVKLSTANDELLQTRARFRVVSNLLNHVSSVIKQPPPGLDEKLFTNHYNNSRSLPFPLMRDLTPQQVALYVERSGQIPSLSLEVQPVRRYTCGSAAAHLLGYVQRESNPTDDEEISYQFRLPDFVGVSGVERAFDQQLRGRAGVKSVLVNNLQYRQSEEIWTPPEPGSNVVLTVDLLIQQATERALKSTGTDTRGAAVVLDCRNGDVLAMASVPTFDPNTFVSRISEEDWAKLTDENLRPLINRATYGTYPPGSILKIIVALAGLECGAINTNEEYVSAGFFQIDGHGHTWRDTAGPGKFKFDRAFYLSSNPYFQEHGLRTGFEKLAEMGRRFGLGQRTGLSTHLEAAGYFPDPMEKVKKDGSRWMAGDTANLCIGQGELKVTPLQMAVMTAAIANGGNVLEPRLVDRIEPADPMSGAEPIRFPPGQIRTELKLNPINLQTVRNAMLLDVEQREEKTGRYGTGHKAAVDGMQVCGKTGTAQLMEGQKLKEHIVWFVSYAPFDAPRYAVVVMIEGGDSGGGTCAPVAHDIYEALLKRERGQVPNSKGALVAN